MNFIVDNQLPPALVGWLRQKGHEASHVFPLGLSEVDDAHIWRLAERDSAVVVTKDADFAERRLHAALGPTILWLRIGNTTTSELFAVLTRAWPEVELRLSRDAVVEVR